MNCIYGVVDEACDILNGMKNKDTFTSPHGNGLCDQKNILEAFKEIARHLALGIVAKIFLNENDGATSSSRLLFYFFCFCV